MNRTKLIMTLFVRDEEDIIEDNICFHLNSGVDHIVAVDNGSKDSTRKILEKYQKLGYVTLFDEPKHAYEQSKWVSFMAKYAVNKLKATHLFHCDADEFWYPTDGNLKRNLPEKNQIFKISLINYIPPPRQSSKQFKYNNFRYAVVKSIDPPPNFSDFLSSKVLLYHYPKKVFTTKQYTEVSMGNHRIITNKKYLSINTNKIFIHHFPIRNYQHFIKRVIRSGTAMLNSNFANPETNWHIRAWYTKYLDGKLPQEYDLLALKNKTDKNFFLSQGNIDKITVPKKIRYAKLLFKLGHPI